MEKKSVSEVGKTRRELLILLGILCMLALVIFEVVAIRASRAVRTPAATFTKIWSDEQSHGHTKEEYEKIRKLLIEAEILLRSGDSLAAYRNFRELRFRFHDKPTSDSMALDYYQKRLARAPSR